MPLGLILYNLGKKADSYSTTVKRKSGLLKDSSGCTECLNSTLLYTMLLTKLYDQE